MMQKQKVVQFRIAQKPHSRIAELRTRLRKQNVKPNIDMILNAILENISMA